MKSIQQMSKIFKIYSLGRANLERKGEKLRREKEKRKSEEEKRIKIEKEKI